MNNDLKMLDGRTAFDKTRYEKFDTLGKKLGLYYLMLVTSKIKHKEILPLFEDKKCGDIKLLDTLTGKITYFEVEVRNKRDFDNNFKGVYRTVDIPLKKFDQIQYGYYIAFDEAEEHNNGIPKRIYGIDVSIIKKYEPQYKSTKFDPGKKELFYMIPKHLVKRYKFDEEKGKYIYVDI
jgi:hypothetical protein